MSWNPTIAILILIMYTNITIILSHKPWSLSMPWSLLWFESLIALDTSEV